MEHEIDDGVYIPPSKQTVSEFLDDFVSLYGEENWSISTYSMNLALIDNYIRQTIGREAALKEQDCEEAVRLTQDGEKHDKDKAGLVDQWRDTGIKRIV